MSDIIKHSIDVTPIGLEKLSQVPAIINKVSDAASKVQPPLDPQNKIVQILSRIEKILMAIGRVGVESFNKLNDVWATNHNGFSKMHEGASKLERQIEKIGTTSRKVGQDVKTGLMPHLSEMGHKLIGLKSIAQTALGGITPIFEEGMAWQNALSDFETLIGKDDAKDYADMVKDAFVNATKAGGQFAGSMESTIEGTLGGKMAVMKSSFDDLKAKLFELALPIAEKILPLITDHVFPLVISTSFVGHVFASHTVVAVIKRVLIAAISELAFHVRRAVRDIIETVHLARLALRQSYARQSHKQYKQKLFS